MISPPSTRFDIVALAASAGGLHALSSVLSPLPGNFPLPIVIVQHLDPHQPSILVPILSRRTHLRVKAAEAGEQPLPTIVYVASPGWHLLLNPDRSFKLTQTPPVHFVRPAADVLFASLATSFGSGVIAVVLTGTGSDGETGVQAVKKAGGFIITQDEGSSEYFGMPGSAIKTGCVDRVLPLDDIPDALINLVMAGTDYGSQ